MAAVLRALSVSAAAQPHKSSRTPLGGLHSGERELTAFPFLTACPLKCAVPAEPARSGLPLPLGEGRWPHKEGGSSSSSAETETCGFLILFLCSVTGHVLSAEMSALVSR